MKKTIQWLSLTVLAAFLVQFGAASATASKTKKSKASNGNVVEGESLFKKNCNMCHYPDKTDTKMGPGLKGLFKNKELPASHRPATEAAVREQIEKGSPNAKPMPMPGFAGKLSAVDMANLIAYLKTL